MLVPEVKIKIKNIVKIIHLVKKLAGQSTPVVQSPVSGYSVYERKVFNVVTG